MTLVIEDVPDHLVERLLARAARNNRTLQEELLALPKAYLASE